MNEVDLRTAPKHPGGWPDGFDNWHDYFESLRTERSEDKVELEASLRPSKLLEPGHEVSVQSVSARTLVGRLARLAEGSGGVVKCGKSRYFTGDHLQLNGKVREGKEGEHVWMQVIVDGHYITYSAEYGRMDGIMRTYEELKKFLEEL